MNAVAEARGWVPPRQLVVSTLLAALALVGLSRAADAVSTGVYYELGNENSQSGNTYIAPTWVTDSTGQPVTTGLQTIAGKVDVTASAAPGVLRASVWQTAEVQSVANTGVSDDSFSHAVAEFQDRITISTPNPALIGSTVTVNASFLLTGDMLATYLLQGNNSSYFSVSGRTTVTVFGTGIAGFVTGRETHGNSGGSLTDVSQPAPLTIPVQFTTQIGSATNIQYHLDLQGSSNASFGFRECGGGYGPCGALASALADADFAHSLLWNGISSITDPSGSPLLDFSVASDSGLDYAAPVAVPEPAAGTLLLAGSVGLAFARRRSARR